ncbi:MAG: hypothetical protein EB007_08490 [Betaproteobacteria bacterium]|nr:hypothetical protein [Betaproteobacteria bacterium]NDE41988.1 hypothetical protein [Betaproteobacteria bacterium]NDE73806.1 hypothetical protein [Betaproteobacteria bacterium]
MVIRTSHRSLPTKRLSGPRRTNATEPKLLIAQRIKATGKLACRDIAAGAWVRTYGEVIGVATTAILAGDHVHVHNIRSVRT